MPTLSKSPQVDVTFFRALLERTQRWDKSARIILFGSRARGDHRYYSDYDALILSDHFAGMEPEKRWVLVQTKLKPTGFDVALEPHCYTSAEWQRMQSSLLGSQIEADGIELSEVIAKMA